MKIIEGLKKAKDLTRKADDLRKKIADHSAHLDIETPVYEDQKGQVTKWLQAHSDVLTEILDLNIAIQRTNLKTEVTITLGDKSVTKCIAAWIHRRRTLANLEQAAYGLLTDKNLREGAISQSTGIEKVVKIVRCFDPQARDEAIELYRSEPSIIDSTLEVINATTDLVK